MVARAWLVAACALTGCNEVWGLQHLEDPEIDAPPPDCTSDDFAGPLIDGTLWTVDSPGTAVIVRIDAGQLAIVPPPLQGGYNGVNTIAARDLTTGSVSVEVVRSLNIANGDTQLRVASVLHGSTDYFLIYTHTTYIGFRKHVSSVQDEDGGAYTSEDRFWRIQFVDGMVSFQTSATGELYVERRRLVADLPLTAMYAQLIAGTFNGGSDAPGEALFDNFKICTALAR